MTSLEREPTARVDDHPGIHFNELTRQLDVTPDTLQRVSERLEAAGAIASANLYGKTHYYPRRYDSWE